ncbi:hypothetical protein F0726_03002 [Acidithiobacillus caldus]|nr:hypothetical protein F0726_03002 [Acidithiobacillus caldus]
MRLYFRSAHRSNPSNNVSPIVLQAFSEFI